MFTASLSSQQACSELNFDFELNTILLSSLIDIAGGVENLQNSEIELNPNATLTIDQNINFELINFYFSYNSKIKVESGITLKTEYCTFNACENTGLEYIIVSEPLSSMIFEYSFFNSVSESRIIEKGVNLSSIFHGGFYECEFVGVRDAVLFENCESSSNCYVYGTDFVGCERPVYLINSDVVFGQAAAENRFFGNGTGIAVKVENSFCWMRKYNYITNFMFAFDLLGDSTRFRFFGKGKQIPLVENCTGAIHAASSPPIESIWLQDLNISNMEEGAIYSRNSNFIRIEDSSFNAASDDKYVGNRFENDNVFISNSDFNNVNLNINNCDIASINDCNVRYEDIQDVFAGMSIYDSDFRLFNVDIENSKCLIQNSSSGSIKESSFRGSNNYTGVLSDDLPHGQLTLKSSQNIVICGNQFIQVPENQHAITFLENCQETDLAQNEFSSGAAGIQISNQIGQQELKGNVWYEVNNNNYVGLSTIGSALLSQFKVNPFINPFHITDANPLSLFDIVDDSNIIGCGSIVLPLISNSEDCLKPFEEEVLNDYSKYCDSINIWINSHLFASKIDSFEYCNDPRIDNWKNSEYFPNALIINQIRSVIGNSRINVEQINNGLIEIGSRFDEIKDSDNRQEIDSVEELLSETTNYFRLKDTINLSILDSLISIFSPLCEFDSTFIKVVDIYRNVILSKDNSLASQYINEHNEFLINTAEGCYSDYGHSKYYAKSILDKYKIQFNEISNCSKNKPIEYRSKQQIQKNELLSIMIFDVSGNLLLAPSIDNADFRYNKMNLPNGVYILMKEFQNHVETDKFIIIN